MFAMTRFRYIGVLSIYITIIGPTTESKKEVDMDSLTWTLFFVTKDMGFCVTVARHWYILEYVNSLTSFNKTLLVF